MYSNKTFVMLSVLALASGFLVGVVPFYQGLSILQVYSVEIKIVYAYFKIYNASNGVIGLGNASLVSYVLVLNVTNPSRETIQLRDVLIEFAGSINQTGDGFEASNDIIRYDRTFSGDVTEYYWSPNSTRLIAFTATEELSTMALAALKSGKGYFLTRLVGRANSGASASSNFSLNEVKLEVLSESEYIYNEVFDKKYRFHFRNDGIGVSLEWRLQNVSG